MKRYFVGLLLNGILVFGLLSCTDPATDIKDGEEETIIADTSRVPPLITENPPADTIGTPVLADTVNRQQ